MDWTSIDWLVRSLASLPALLWIYLGLGIPLALLLMPRRDWHERIMVAALALALGSAALTAWMLILGVLGANDEQPLLRLDLTLAGTMVIAVVGWLFTWAKLRRTRDKISSDTVAAPLAADETLIIGMMIFALILRWLVTAFYPFTAYDALWVYGYQPRLYLEMGFIPHSIDYYPQFMQLQFAYAQLAVGGIDDHAARSVIPFMHLGSILAAYLLGKRLLNRRVGIFLAGLWALYPHVGDWAHIGDLEIPLTFLFTLTAVFFLMAWMSQERAHRQRYAVMAGVIFGIAMWTKPTAGAFIWAVIMVVALELLRVRFDWRRWLPRFEVAFLTGLACIPLGSIWYLRNILLGHHPIDLPPDFWLTQARQSGDLFGWLLLGLFTLLAYLFLKQRQLINWRLIVPGVILILAALLPSMPLINPARFDPPQSRLMLMEWVLLLLGCALIAFSLYRYARVNHGQIQWDAVYVVGWALLIALPYFITWFVSYSYHYRLVFAITPLLMLPTAAILAHWIQPERLLTRFKTGWAYMTLVALLGVPGITAALFDNFGNTGWLWSDQYPNDEAKYRATNPSIMLLADELRDYVAETGQEPVIIAPGEQRLHFFFPTWDIDFETVPVLLEELEGATHYIYGTLARTRYEAIGVAPLDNQIVSSLGRQDIMRQQLRHTDATFSYELYELNLARRSPNLETENPTYIFPDEIIFGDIIRLWGSSGVDNHFTGSNDISIRMLWEALEPLDTDYMISLDLVNMDDGQLYYEFDNPVAVGEHGYYGSHLWDPGEYVLDRRFIKIPGDIQADMPSGDNYHLLISVEHRETGERLPVTINGEPAGDSFPFVLIFRVN